MHVLTKVQSAFEAIGCKFSSRELFHEQKDDTTIALYVSPLVTVRLLEIVCF